MITFRKADAILEFPTFEGDKAGDIWFQFKTTASDGVMIHDTGDTDDDFIQIRMISKFSGSVGQREAFLLSVITLKKYV